MFDTKNITNSRITQLHKSNNRLILAVAILISVFLLLLITPIVANAPYETFFILWSSAFIIVLFIGYCLYKLEKNCNNINMYSKYL